MLNSAAVTEAPPNRPGPHRAFNILGPVEVRIDDVPVRLGGPGQVAVLARLLLSPGLVISMDQLADSVWEGPRPARPDVVIRSNISNLRRSIEPDRDRGDPNSCIANHPPGYRLDVDVEEIDANRFEGLIDRARGELTIGRFAVALQQLDSAFRLWRGEPCEGMIESDAVYAARARLGELHLAAVELRFEARLSLGEHEAVIPDLEAAIVETPRRERLTELGMRALYQAGRQSEALALCQRLRARLIEELGIDPGPPIQALEHQILTHDASLSAPGERIAATRVAATPRAVPTVTGPLGGRHREFEGLMAIGEVLAAGRGVMALVTGEVGSGKSALAAAVGNRFSEDGSLVVWGHCHRSARSIDLWPWGPLLDALAPAVTPDALAGLEALTALSPSLHSITGDTAGQTRRAEGSGWPKADAAESGARSAPVSTPVDEAAHGSESGSGSARGSSYEAAVGNGRNLMLAQCVVELLRRISSSRPLVVVMEDAHWADPASIELLSMTASSLSSHPVAFVVTFLDSRSVDVDSRRALQSLARLPGTTRYELRELDVDATDEVLQLTAPTIPAAERRRVARSVCDLSGGNAFLTSEIIDTLLASGTGIHPIIGGVGGSIPSTAATRDWVLDRVERCHPSASIVLSAAGLFEGEIVAEALAIALELDRSHVEAVLETAVVDGLLADLPSASGTGLRFRQRIVAEVVAESLPSPRRSRLHAALAHALWRRGAESSDLAFHFGRSDSVGASILAARFALDAVAQSPGPRTMGRAQEAAMAALDPLGELESADPLEVELCYVLLQVARLRGDWHSLEEIYRRLFAIQPAPEDRDAYDDLRRRASMIATGRPVGCDDPAKVAWVLPPIIDGERARMIGAILGPTSGGHPLDAIIRQRLGLPEARDAGSGSPLLEASIKALRHGSSAERQQLALQLHGSLAGPLDSHDEILMVRLALVGLLEMSPSTAVAEALSLIARRPAILDVDRPMPPLRSDPSFVDLDLLALRVTIDLLHGRLDNAEAGMEQLNHALSGAGFGQGALGGVQRVLSWNRGAVGNCDENNGGRRDGSFRPPSVFQPQQLSTSTGLASDYRRQLDAGSVLAPGSQGLSAAIDEAFGAAVAAELDRANAWLDRVVELADGRSEPVSLSEEGAALVAVCANRCGHRPAAALALFSLERAPAAVVTTVGGLAVLGPTAYFTGLAAATDGGVMLARDRLVEAERWSRLARARPSLVRTLIAQAELDALDGARDVVDARVAEAKAIAADIGMGWLDDLRLP